MCSCREILDTRELSALKHDYVNRRCTACGELKSSEGLDFRLNDSGEAYTVYGRGQCNDIDLIIPSHYNDKPVTAVRHNAFHESSGIMSITIPDTVTDIESYAFSNIRGLKRIYIGNGVKNIGENTFTGSGSLEEIVVNEKIPTLPFRENVLLTRKTEC